MSVVVLLFEPGVEVAIVAREVAGGNVQADAVARAEHVAGYLEVDGDLVDRARLSSDGSIHGSR